MCSYRASDVSDYGVLPTCVCSVDTGPGQGRVELSKESQDKGMCPRHSWLGVVRMPGLWVCGWGCGGALQGKMGRKPGMKAGEES